MDSERTYQAKVIHRHPVTVVRTMGRRGNITDEILEVRNSAKLTRSTIIYENCHFKLRREGEEDSGREVKKIEVRHNDRSRLANLSCRLKPAIKGSIKLMILKVE